jgi:hypothetical protein
MMQVRHRASVLKGASKMLRDWLRSSVGVFGCFPLIVEALNHFKVRSCLIADQAVRRIGSSSRTRTRPQ